LQKTVVFFRYTVKQMHEYYAHAQKTEKFIMQLRHTTHRERHNTAKYSNIT